MQSTVVSVDAQRRLRSPTSTIDSEWLSMNCWYGNFFDFNNPVHPTRENLIPYAFFYDKIVDNLGYREALDYLSAFGKQAETKGFPSAPDQSPLEKITVPKFALDYLLREVVVLTGANDQEALQQFVQDINPLAQSLYELRFLPESGKFEELPAYIRLAAAIDFQTLLRKFVLYAESLDKVDELFERLADAGLLASQFVISLDQHTGGGRRQLPLTQEQIERSKWGDGEHLTPEQSARLLSLEIANEVKLHYVCENDPFLARHATQTTSIVKHADTTHLSVKALIALRATKEWQEMARLFDAHHAAPLDRHLALSLQESIDALQLSLKKRQKASLIGFTLNALGLAPIIGQFTSAGQAVQSFLDALRAFRTLGVMRKQPQNTTDRIR